MSERHGGIHVKKYMLDVADRIICAEHHHSDWIVQNIDKKYLSKIEIIELGDTENFMSDQLIKSLESKFVLFDNQHP